MSQENVRVRTAVLAAVIALVLAGCDDDEDSTTEATPSPEQKIEQTGNKWAPLFAAAADRAACRYMTQPACEQMTCERISGPIKNCTPRSSGFRKSFANARVERIVLEDDKRPGGDRNRPAGVRYAAAEFSNGELVEFWTNPGRNWLIDKLGGNAGRRFFEQTTTEATLSPEQKIERTGNKWAPLFAAAPNPEACAEFDELHPYREVAAKYMTQPACEQVVCERVATGPIKNCTPSSSGFPKSFADATVRDVAIKGNRAGAKFANGEAVEFVRDPVSEFSSDWPIHKIGGNAGRRFFEAAGLRE